jgi:hypothetical protein
VRVAGSRLSCSSDGVYEVLRSYGVGESSPCGRTSTGSTAASPACGCAPRCRAGRLEDLLDSLLRRSTYREARIYVQV